MEKNAGLIRIEAELDFTQLGMTGANLPAAPGRSLPWCSPVAFHFEFIHPRTRKKRLASGKRRTARNKCRRVVPRHPSIDIGKSLPSPGSHGLKHFGVGFFGHCIVPLSKRGHHARPS
jgi:hypothetical protein